jgi:hypothetical protein
MNFTEWFVIFIMVIVLAMYIQGHYAEIDIVESNVDHRKYVVQKLPDKQRAADFLASVNKDILKLIDHMKKKYPEKREVTFMANNYNPNAISEGSLTGGYTSYSVNKGEKVILCIRQEDKSFVEKNVVMYVAIHELAHIYTHNEIGHTDQYWKNFRLLLEEAIQIGIYKKEDYNKVPKDYCGIKITSTIL